MKTRYQSEIDQREQDTSNKVEQYRKQKILQNKRFCIQHAIKT